MSSKIPIFTFYYVLPSILGFSAGLIYRDYTTIDINKKITMSLADYYLLLGEKPDKRVNREFPEVNRLLKKMEG
jgi:hypothetical protein